MPISNSYPKGIPIEDRDLIVGTKASNNRTVNYTAQGVADYLNINSKVSIGGQMSFQFSIVPNVPKTIAFEGGWDDTPFSAITRLVVSAIDLSVTNITVFLNYLKDSEILLTQQNQPNFFGHYKIMEYAQIGTSEFYTLDLEFIGGNGNIGKDQYYDLVSFVLNVETPPLQEVATVGNTYEDENYIITLGTDALIIEDKSNGKKTILDTISLYFEKPFGVGDTSHVNIQADNLDDGNKITLQVPNKPTGEYTIATTEDIIVPTLGSVLAENNTTDGNDIDISEGDAIVLDNGSKLKKGTTDSGNGLGGIALKCSIDYELKWDAGRLYVMEQDGFTIRESLYNFTFAPTEFDDSSKGFVIGSRWTLDNGEVYECTDDIVDNAVWTLLPSGGVQSVTGDIVDNTDPFNPIINIPTLQQVAIEGNIYEDDDYKVTINTDSIEVLTKSNGSYSKLEASGEISSYNPILEKYGYLNYGSFGLSKGIDGEVNFSMNDIDSGNILYLEAPNKNGTYTIATTDDIPTTGYLPKTTASGTDTYTASVTGVTAYNDGDAYLVRFTNGNTTGCTLNINTLGAKTLYRNNDGALIGGDILDGAEMLCVYNSSNDNFQVIGTSPNSLFAYVTNADSVTLTKGMPVYAYGGTGDRLRVKRAYNTTDATSAQTIGLVLSISIGVNQKGLIMMQGLLDNLSILPTSTFADGDPIYLGATAGTITNVKPYAPNHLVYLGVVTTASNGNAGRLYVRVQNGYEMDELHNVSAQNPANYDGLFYNTTTHLWEKKNVFEVAPERRNANNSTDAKINYCGSAPKGSSESATVWKIYKIVVAYDGTTTTTSATNVAWTNRESVIYT